LLPIPPLDGGHILFTLVEKIRRKPLTPAVAERIYAVAFMFMLALFVLITALDIFFPVNLTP
jgi:regulator of sigma E protease